MSQFKKDLISSFVFLAFGALVLIAVPLTIKDPGVSVMGPQVFPTFIGVCMVALSLALLAVTLVKHRKEAAAREQAGAGEPGERKAALRDELRAVVLDPKNDNLSDEAELLIYEAISYNVSPETCIDALLFETRDALYRPRPPAGAGAVR